jgi:hypothetical protein
MIIPLTGVSNAQVLQVTITGATDGVNTLPSFNVNAGFLLGDTTANRTTNSSDVSQAKSQSGSPLTSSTFRSDVTVNGIINSSDVAAVKAASGTAIP